MHGSLLLSYPEDIEITSWEDGDVVLQSSNRRLNLGRPLFPSMNLLGLLRSPGVRMSLLKDSCQGFHRTQSLAYMHHYLNRLTKHGFLHVVASDGSPSLATLVPKAWMLSQIAVDGSMNGEFRLSRFACLRRVENEIVVDTPLSNARVYLPEPRIVGLLMELAVPTTCKAISDRYTDFTRESIEQMMQMLRAARIIQVVADDGSLEEELNPAIESWEYHDLYFHAHSRQGRHNGPVGALYKMSKTHKPLPAVKPCDDQNALVLYRPDIEKQSVTSLYRFFRHLLRLPVEFFTQRYAGEVSSRIEINDRVAGLLSGDLAANMLNIVMIVCYVALMLWYDLLLTIVAIAIVGSTCSP